MSEIGDKARFLFFACDCKFYMGIPYDFMESCCCNHIFNVGVHKGLFNSDELDI